jgi:hypothetical protein
LPEVALAFGLGLTVPKDLTGIGRLEVGDQVVEEVQYLDSGLVCQSRPRLRDIVVVHRLTSLPVGAA